MNFKSKITGLLYSGLNWCSDHSAEICTGVAVVTSVTAVVATVKATKDVIPELEAHKNEIAIIKANKQEDGIYYHHINETDAEKFTGEEADKQYKKDLTLAYAKTGLTIAKRYAIPAVLEITAVATIISSNKISRQKNAALAGALSGLQVAYDKYRENVIAAVGEDKERDIRLGLHKEKISEEEVDENGKTKKVKKDVDVVDPDKLSDPFTYIYDEKADNFNKSRGVNRDVLMIKQAYWNDFLVRHKRVFVNQILEDIGLSCYCTPLGQVYGWIYDETGGSGSQNYISFNIEDNARFMGNYDPSCIISLNPDGNILDKAFINKPIETKKAWAGANY